MRRIAKILILLLVFAALPLRGYAAAIKALCEHHAGSQAGHHVMHEHTAEHEHGSPQDGDAAHGDLASFCSFCSTCSVGAPLAPDAVRWAAPVVTVSDRIPFLGHAQPGFVPGCLDRPPLAL